MAKDKFSVNLKNLRNEKGITQFRYPTGQSKNDRTFRK